MPRTSKISKSPPSKVSSALQGLGNNIKMARLRRKIRAEDLAERIGISRRILSDVEKGKPTTAIAAYLGALWALGLIEQMKDVAHPDNDDEGKALERSRSPKKASMKRELDNDF